MSHYTIYTDGACSGNPGPGGWAAILVSSEGITEISGGELQTTNNRMELIAVIEGLRKAPSGSQIKLISDSSYVVNGASDWMKNWKARGWRRKDGELLNADLWQAIDREVAKHSVQWEWVKGHAGNSFNERADWLAVKSMPKSG